MPSRRLSPLRRRPAAPAALSDCRGRLSVVFQITRPASGQVEFAYRTEWTQVLTTVVWGGRIDDVSRRVLTGALRAAADGHSARLSAFAAAARDLFRHTGYPAGHGLSDPFIAEAAPLHG